MSKRRKKAKGKNKIARHIPVQISKKVEERHFFECAWCGIPMTERHHIKEWHLGGEHSEENLILLCPNCHTKTHQGIIRTEQLKDRKSTHLKGDRISGGFQTTLKELKFKVGNNIVEDARHIIAIGYQPILSVEDINGFILISASFYGKNGNLTFWMSKNLFWAPSYYKITSSQDLLIIDDEKLARTILKIQKKGDYLQVECENYLDHSLFRITPDKDVIIKTSSCEAIFSNNYTKGYHIGFWICDSSHTREGFLKLNNEKTDKKGSFLVTEPNRENVVVDRRFFYSSVRIDFYGDENATGTGFILFIHKGAGEFYPILTLRKTLAKNTTNLKIHLVYPEKKKPQGVYVPDFKKSLIFHPDENIGLCVINLADAFNFLIEKFGVFEAVTSLDFGLIEHNNVVILDILTGHFKYRTIGNSDMNSHEIELSGELPQSMIGSPVFSYIKHSRPPLTYLDDLKLIGIYQGNNKVIKAKSLLDF